MENQEGKKNYTIDINSKIYSFSCDGGMEHVELVKAKLNQVLRHLSLSGEGQSLSDMAMRLGFFLADDSAKHEIKYNNVEKEVSERLEPLLDQLNKVLD
jgi:cell division protein ZapA (FtsZ GTPase activity inhibitor)